MSARTVVDAFRAGDPLAGHILQEVTKALIAGGVTLVNAFNPERLILGGGIVEGLPELVGWVGEGVRCHALGAATEPLQVLASLLGNDAGAIGAAACAMRSTTGS
jgi:glucokinase